MNPIYIALIVFGIAVLIPLFVRFNPLGRWVVTVGLLLLAYLVFFAFQCVEVGLTLIVSCVLYSFISFLGIPYLIVVSVGASIGVGLSVLRERYLKNIQM